MHDRQRLEADSSTSPGGYHRYSYREGKWYQIAVVVHTEKNYPFGVREKPKRKKCSLDSDTCMRQMRLVRKNQSIGTGGVRKAKTEDEW
jgi:hypothetical protein